MTKRKMVAGVDAGGTTFKLGIMEPGQTRPFAKTNIATLDPKQTIDASVTALRGLADEAGAEIVGLGIGSFGPADVSPASPTYGTILATPKAHWSGVRLLEELRAGLGVPARFDTDVNAALLAEMAWGAGQGFERVAYVTVGTGIGVGIETEGMLAGRPYHPELGHIRLERHRDDLDVAGSCAFHGACLEGLASGPALARRFGPLEKLKADHAAWRVTGFYLAQLCLVLCLGWRVQRIVLGGGVLNAPGLLPLVRESFAELNQGYVPAAEAADPLIAGAGLGGDAGLLGALLLAERGVA